MFDYFPKAVFYVIQPFHTDHGIGINGPIFTFIPKITVGFFPSDNVVTFLVNDLIK